MSIDEVLDLFIFFFAFSSQLKSKVAGMSHKLADAAFQNSKVPLPIQQLLPAGDDISF